MGLADTFSTMMQFKFNNAVSDNAVFWVRQYIALGVDVNCRTILGVHNRCTPLWNAAKNGYTAIVKLILDTNQAAVNISPLNGIYAECSPLWIAAHKGHSEIVRLLLQANAVNVNSAAVKCVPGSTPLWIAAHSLFADNSENTQIIAAILQAPDVNIHAMPTEGEHKGCSALWAAARNGNLSMVRLLHTAGIDVDKAPTEGEFANVTPLWIAACYGRLSTVEYLHAHGANINACGTAEGLDGHTPIYAAAINEHFKTVKFLLENNADTKYLVENWYELSAKMQNFIYDLYFAQIVETPDIQTYANILSKIPKLATVYTPEVDAHDISFAKVTFEEVSAYFAEHNIPTLPYEKAFVMTRDLIARRILAEDNTKLWFRELIQNKSTATEIPQSILIPYIDRTNVNHKAYEWIMTFNRRMSLLTSLADRQAVELMRNMLCAIVACINDLHKNGQQRQAEDITDALIIQLDNAMDANENSMSCAPGTPRFFRVVLQAYLDMVKPQEKLEFKAAANVMDNLLRAYFAHIIAKYESIDKNWTNINTELIEACEAFADLGLDNISAFQKGEDILGRVSEKPFDTDRLKLRCKIMYNAYPNYEAFHAAICKNLGNDPEYVFQQYETMYFRSIYYAISDAYIRERLYQSLESQKQQLSKQHELQTAPEQLSRLIKEYTNSMQSMSSLAGRTPAQQTIMAKRKLEDKLINISKLLIGENYDLALISEVATGIVSDVANGVWQENDAEKIIESLRRRFKPASSSNRLRNQPR